MPRMPFLDPVRMAAISCAFLLPAAAWAQTAPLAGDTYIHPGDATIYGGLPTINVGGAADSHGLLMFDLSQFTGSTVAWARLRLFVNKVNTTGAVDLYAASAAWTEANVNGTSGIVAGNLIQAGISISAPAVYITVDVTNQVRSWVGGSSNTGFLIQANPGSTEVFLDSKENAATSHPATLEVVLGGTSATGPAGPAGAPGAQGAQGLAGAAGPIGNAGPAGPAGVAGATGATGATGPVGPTGASGASGNPGPAGTVGATGATGPVGPTGARGASGANGAAGPAGATGATGPLGLRGNAGAAGAAGPAGPGFSNIDLVSPTTLTSGATIPDNDTHLVYFVNNSGGPVTVTLPHANASGGTPRQVRISTTSPLSGGNLTVTTQAGDSIWGHVLTTGVTTLTVPAGITVASDGASRWYQLWAQ